MGATTFETYGFGKDLTEAFRQAQEDALYWHGHDGYTGTIAEKPGAILLRPPKGVSARKFLGWLSSYEDTRYIAELEEELKRLQTTRAPRGQGAEWRKRRSLYAKEIRQMKREAAKLPAQHMGLILRAHEIFDSKWDEALALEITGAEATKIKASRNLKGTRKRVFMFCGYASC